MGLGLHGGGLGVAEWLAKHKLSVKITDLKTRVELKKSLQPLRKYSQIKYRLGSHVESDFRQTDVVIANPGVRLDNKYLQIARQAGAEIYNDISLFMKLCPARVIGITGTKGKSTTASLIYHFLKKSKKSVYLGGNICISPFIFLDKLKPTDWVVLEMSSWQCEGLLAIKRSPQISLLTNLDKDHLNTYKSYSAYIKAKSLIFKYQVKIDWAILNQANAQSMRLVPKLVAQKCYFNIRAKANNYIKNNKIYYRDQLLMQVDKLPIVGQHNIANILSALTVAEILKLSRQTLQLALLDYQPLVGRLETIRVKNKVRYINDTTATAPPATLASLQALSGSIVLIAGGVDKKLDLKSLARAIMQRSRQTILLPGSATDQLIMFFKNKHYIDYQLASSMSMAVKLASQSAQPGEVVLLSPGAASFGLFINEFDRGDKFNQAVKSL